MNIRPTIQYTVATGDQIGSGFNLQSCYDVTWCTIVHSHTIQWKPVFIKNGL